MKGLPEGLSNLMGRRLLCLEQSAIKVRQSALFTVLNWPTASNCQLHCFSITSPGRAVFALDPTVTICHHLLLTHIWISISGIKTIKGWHFESIQVSAQCSKYKACKTAQNVMRTLHYEISFITCFSPRPSAWWGVFLFDITSEILASEEERYGIMRQLTMPWVGSCQKMKAGLSKLTQCIQHKWTLDSILFQSNWRLTCPFFHQAFAVCYVPGFVGGTGVGWINAMVSPETLGGGTYLLWGSTF